jgi:hypothetical protein
VIVIDLHLVQNAGIEREVIGAVRGLEEGIDVEDHDRAIGAFGADEGEPVRDVGLLIERGDGRLAMAGGRDGRGCMARAAIDMTRAGRQNFCCTLRGLLLRVWITLAVGTTSGMADRMRVF